MSSEVTARETALSRVETLLGPEAVERLRRARVAVIGVGGVGSWAAQALVRTGVGHVTLVDCDAVAPSNINRQAQAMPATVGAPKVRALAEQLAAIAPDCRIAALQDRYTADCQWFRPEDYDLVIDAIDSVADKAALMMRVTGARVPLLSSMGAARRTDPTRVRVAEFWRVTGCPLARALRDRFRRCGERPKRKIRCAYSEEPPLPPAPEGCPNGSLMQVTAAFGMALAAEAVRQLTGK